MKILYLSNWKESSGYSSAARGYLEAMLSVGLDVVPRNIRITGSKGEVSDSILRAEQKSAFGATHLIQHTLPEFYSYQGGVVNIGLFATESDSIHYSGWANKCNLMDEIWVINEQSKEVVSSSVNVPVHVVPHAFDMVKYQTNHEPLDLPILKDITVFYFIGEFTRRKNLGPLLKAFHSEFGPNDRVMLLLKTYVAGQHPDNAVEIIRNYCSEIKRGLRLYKDESHYRPEIIVTHHLSDLDICRLHKSCHIYVTTSCGEAFDIPAFEAMAFGNTVIAATGHADYLNCDNSYQVDNQEQIAFGQFDTMPNLYTGYENFLQINEVHLKSMLRKAYEEHPNKQKSETGINHSYNYSYENIGLRIKELLK